MKIISGCSGGHLLVGISKALTSPLKYGLAAERSGSKSQLSGMER